MKIAEGDNRKDLLPKELSPCHLRLHTSWLIIISSFTIRNLFFERRMGLFALRACGRMGANRANCRNENEFSR